MSGFQGSLSTQQSAALAKLRASVEDWTTELTGLDPDSKVSGLARPSLTAKPAAAAAAGAGAGGTGARASGASAVGDPSAAQVLAEVAEGPFADDRGLLQLLRARKFDVAKALELLRKLTGYRVALQPSSISGRDIPNALPSKCWTWGGFTRAGNPILVVRARLWKPSTYESDEEYLRMIVYFTETATRSMGEGVERFTILFDLGGFNSEMASPRALTCLHHLVTLTQSIYPEHLASALLFNVPFVFRAVWSVIRPWIDPVTAAKVFFLGSEYEDELLEQIAPEMLCSEFGGKREEPWPGEARLLGGGGGVLAHPCLVVCSYLFALLHSTPPLPPPPPLPLSSPRQQSDLSTSPSPRESASASKAPRARRRREARASTHRRRWCQAAQTYSETPHGPGRWRSRLGGEKRQRCRWGRACAPPSRGSFPVRAGTLRSRWSGRGLEEEGGGGGGGGGGREGEALPLPPPPKRRQQQQQQQQQQQPQPQRTRKGRRRKSW